MISSVISAKPAGDAAPETSAAALSRTSLRERVRQATRELEAAIILQTLEQHRWNRRHTATALNISYRSLMYKMKLCDVRNAIAARKSEAD